MIPLLFVVLAVVLPAPFGNAEAAAVDDRGGLTVEISVEVTQSFEAVLVRPVSSYEELPPTALIERADGDWGGFVVFPTAEDWSVVFEGIEPDGASVRSPATLLTGLGVDPVVVAAEPQTRVGTPVSSTMWWLWGGIALALVALGFLAWWTFAGSDDAAERPTRPAAGSVDDPGS